MGKFTKSKHVPSFLKEPNYYAKHEKFDDDIEESVEECQTCGKKEYTEPTQEHMVKSFDRFLMEKKGTDLTGDGKIDGEDWKAARDMAIKGTKTKTKTPAKGKAKPIALPVAKSKKKMEPIEEIPTKKKKGLPAVSESSNHGYMEEGHTCRCGTKMMVSDAAHYLMESVCESIMEDAKHYSEHIGSFEDYINECASYMENKMYDLADDGTSNTMNESWNNESACYESTKMMLDEMCEAICHEALRIHSDPTPREFDQYVSEGIGCYRNGMMESTGHGMQEGLGTMALVSAIKSKEDPRELENKRKDLVNKFIAMSNNPKSLSMSPDQQANHLGITVDELIDLAKSTAPTQVRSSWLG